MYIGNTPLPTAQPTIRTQMIFKVQAAGELKLLPVCGS